MILLDRTVGTTHASPLSAPTPAPDGRTTVIILDRDGSLHHYPPDPPAGEHHAARVDLDQHQAQPSLFDRLFDFTFDILGINKLEVRVYDPQQH